MYKCLCFQGFNIYLDLIILYNYITRVVYSNVFLLLIGKSIIGGVNVKKSSRKNSSYLVALVLLLLVGMSIGYAAISTTLNINGKSSIGKATWDVHFENLKVTSGSVTATKAAAIDSGKTNITYEIPLSIPGDFYEFTVDVKNGGSIPAKVSANPTLGGISSAEDVYLNYTVTYSDGRSIAVNDALAAGATASYKVRVEFDENISNSQLPSEAKTLDLTFAVNYVQN